MARTVSIGNQDFEEIILNNYFYIDKTDFIKEWWENADIVTLITRPRRFGKTLTLHMLERFFSLKYSGKGELFSGLKIWEDKKFQELQGTFPVISLSFSGIKGNTFEETKRDICQMIATLYDKNNYLCDSGILTRRELKYFNSITEDMPGINMAISLQTLCDFMQRYYGKKVIILLDEYDTPMQEAFINNYWDELISFIRNLFNSTFKSNPYLERAIMTGITRISKESIFSDLNNMEVVTSTSNKYAESFGFTQKEVSDALIEFDLYENESKIKYWYDGFTFGNKTDIYSPWSIINFLDKKKLNPYWANTSSNSLVSTLIREGNGNVKMITEDLLSGNTFHTRIDEQIAFDQLRKDETAIWSLLLASGYLKVEKYTMPPETEEEEYDLKLTNNEVKRMFKNMIRGWFGICNTHYNGFLAALLRNDIEEMNLYMNDITLSTFSFFDTGKSSSKPECFYHGFVLGLMVDLADRYTITSNRESGYGRYDIMLKPKNKEDHAIIIEFKVHNKKNEENLNDTVRTAKEQIEKMNYTAGLISEGIPANHIRTYGFAFEGKNVLIG